MQNYFEPIFPKPFKLLDFGFAYSDTEAQLCHKVFDMYYHKILADGWNQTTSATCANIQTEHFHKLYYPLIQKYLAGDPRAISAFYYVLDKVYPPTQSRYNYANNPREDELNAKKNEAIQLLDTLIRQRNGVQQHHFPEYGHVFLPATPLTNSGRKAPPLLLPNVSTPPPRVLAHKPPVVLPTHPYATYPAPYVTTKGAIAHVNRQNPQQRQMMTWTSQPVLHNGKWMILV
jgi:hypothetical protein